MLITESQMSVGRQTNVLGLLDNMSYLTEAESVYAPAMVPVVESQTYQAHLIRLEDMMSFAESNGIEDLGYALTLVCEASQIDPSTIAFTVQEENIIADPEVASLAAGIMNEGVRIAAVPVNSNFVECWTIDAAVTQLIESAGEDSTLLDAICNEDYSMFITEAEEKKKDALEQKRMEIGRHLDDDQPGDPPYKKAEGFIEKVKAGSYKGRDWLARQLAKANEWARKINEKIKEDMAKNNKQEASIWQKIKNKIAQLISWITQKLGNAIGTNDDKHLVSKGQAYGGGGYKHIADHDFSLGSK